MLYQTQKVYNFEVENWHTYFVGMLGVLVHNLCKIKKVLKEIGADMLSAVAILGKDSNKVSHILQDKHLWEKLVPDKNWNDISKLIDKTMKEGIEETYKSVNKKALQVGEETIEVTYKKIGDDIFISDAWIKSKQ